MSTNKTQSYQLHAWGLADEPTLGEVNENFAKLDAALKAEENGRTAALAGKVGIAVGSYVGNDVEERTISLGFTPKAVYLCTEAGWTGFANGSSVTYGGLAFPDHPTRNGTNSPLIELTGTGIRVRHLSYYLSTNSKYYTYYYVAFR